MNKNRSVIAKQNDLVKIGPWSLLVFDGKSKIFFGEMVIAADSFSSSIRLLPDRRYRQYLATRGIPHYRPLFWRRWMLDAWNISTPIAPESMKKVRIKK